MNFDTVPLVNFDTVPLVTLISFTLRYRLRPVPPRFLRWQFPPYIFSLVTYSLKSFTTATCQKEIVHLVCHTRAQLSSVACVENLRQYLSEVRGAAGQEYGQVVL